jgi:hypothetical protein
LLAGEVAIIAVSVFKLPANSVILGANSLQQIADYDESLFKCEKLQHFY